MISDFWEKHKNSIIQTGVGFLTACVVSAGIFGGYSIAKHNNIKDYSSHNYIQNMCDMLSVDDSYIKNENIRLKHNGDEPIYVSISDDFPKEFRNELHSALDHVFGLVGEINPKYQYKIIDSVDTISLKNKTTIKILFEPPVSQADDDYVARASRNLNEVKHFDRTKDGGYLIKKMIVTFNKDYINAPHSDDEDYYIFYEKQHLIKVIMVHELLHCFGLDDVYKHKTNIVHLNTIMQTQMAHTGVTIISPNDYKILRAMYAPNFNDESEKFDYIMESAKAIDEYSKEYYSNHNKHQEYRFSNTEEPKLLTINDGTYYFNSLAVENSNIYSIKVNIKNGHYRLTTFDQDYEPIEHCSGDVYFVNGKAYLHNVDLKSFYNSLPYITDLVLMRRGNSSNVDTIYLTDLVDNIYGLKTIKSSQKVNVSNSTEVTDSIESTYCND